MSFDTLTGLYHRSAFFEKIEQLVREQPDRYYLICSNISGFKFYNELFGEEKGNQVLQSLAETLKKLSDRYAAYGRVSTDEFAILARVEAFSEAHLLKNIRLFQNRFSTAQYRMHVYAGIYELEDLSASAASMYEKTKIAMETIRGDYSTNLVYYRDGMLLEKKERQRIIGEFCRALKDGQFSVYLQPQMRSEGELLGAEALVRWRHPQRGMISPARFIPVLEESSLISCLDCFVWEEAARLLQKWKRAGHHKLYVSVNVSAIDFQHVDVYQHFTSLVEKYEIDPANLKIEMTETAFLEDLKHQKKVMERLQAYGFEIEMDDFGSGYSSLAALKDLMVDVVKLDMGFLGETAHEERSWHILQSIVALTQKLGIRIITEGVESEEQVNKLSEIGCDLFQGYYFAKPMEEKQFASQYLSGSGAEWEDDLESAEEPLCFAGGGRSGILTERTGSYGEAL